MRSLLLAWLCVGLLRVVTIAFACTDLECSMLAEDIDDLEEQEANLASTILLQSKLSSEKVTATLPADGEIESTKSGNHTSEETAAAKANDHDKTLHEVLSADGVVANRDAGSVSEADASTQDELREAAVVQTVHAQDADNSKQQAAAPQGPQETSMAWSLCTSLLAVVVMVSLYLIYRRSAELNEKDKASQLLMEFESSEKAKRAQEARTERLLSKIVQAAKREETDDVDAENIAFPKAPTFVITDELVGKAKDALLNHEARHSEAAKRIEECAAELMQEAKVAMIAKRVEDRAAKLIKEPASPAPIKVIEEPNLVHEGATKKIDDSNMPYEDNTVDIQEPDVEPESEAPCGLAY